MVGSCFSHVLAQTVSPRGFARADSYSCSMASAHSHTEGVRNRTVPYATAKKHGKKRQKRTLEKLEEDPAPVPDEGEEGPALVLGRDDAQPCVELDEWQIPGVFGTLQVELVKRISSFVCSPSLVGCTRSDGSTYLLYHCSRCTWAFGAQQRWRLTSSKDKHKLWMDSLQCQDCIDVRRWRSVSEWMRLYVHVSTASAFGLKLLRKPNF